MAAWKRAVVSLAATLIAARVEAGGVFPFPVPEYIDVPHQNASPYGITVGPSGDVWFTEREQDRIGRIAPDLHIDEFPIPVDFASAGPTAITLGSDGNLWFIENNAHKVGRITPEGTFADFPLPSSDRFPLDITSG